MVVDSARHHTSTRDNPRPLVKAQLRLDVLRVDRHQPLCEKGAAYLTELRMGSNEEAIK